ncbi:MAG: hypothetical protein ACFE7I_02540 [Candidatus Hodarchaeota archaeon]
MQIANIDTYDGTPMADLKAYFPVIIRVKEAQIHEWPSYWPEWISEEGFELED